MKLRKAEIVNLSIVVISFIAAAYIYPSLPARVASHWDINGNVNGYMGRFGGAFLVPLLALGLEILFIIVPRIDPKKTNIEKFRTSFDRFVSLFLLFIFYVYALTLFFTFGFKFNMGQFLSPAFAVLFLAVAFLIKNAEPNWSIGIRTPWTLSNDVVWRKTHLLGSRLFTYSALVALVGTVFPDQAIWFMLAPVIISSVGLVIYSYVEYGKATLRRG